ncbi:protein phosphatase 1 regulatory subunit 3B [Oryzias melastigma]|nr:protein phosphatase 1 regulatory subunit 3B [Oryzias melastigma]
MPIDVTIPLYLSNEDFSFVAAPNSQKAPRSSCPDVRQLDDDGEAVPAAGGTGATKTKKRVTFADSKGLALTSVKVFSQFTDPIDIPASIQDMLRAPPTLTPEDSRLVLDFPQPSSDYLLFRQNLEANQVSLEHCVLKEKAFAGTIKVKNVSYEKAVTLRVTFDSWKSHLDVACQYMKDAYPSSYSDTFCYEVALPAELPPHQHVEFAVCYEVGGAKHWDSNQGRNYCIVRSHVKSGRHADRRMEMHFDRYGSPTCSHGLFPDWPSYAGFEDVGPYY